MCFSLISFLHVSMISSPLIAQQQQLLWRQCSSARVSLWGCNRSHRCSTAVQFNYWYEHKQWIEAETLELNAVKAAQDTWITQRVVIWMIWVFERYGEWKKVDVWIMLQAFLCSVCILSLHAVVLFGTAVWMHGPVMHVCIWNKEILQTRAEKDISAKCCHQQGWYRSVPQVWCHSFSFQVAVHRKFSLQLQMLPRLLMKADRKPCPIVNIKTWTASRHSPASCRRCASLWQEITPETRSLTNLIVTSMSCFFFPFLTCSCFVCQHNHSLAARFEITAARLLKNDKKMI